VVVKFSPQRSPCLYSIIKTRPSEADDFPLYEGGLAREAADQSRYEECPVPEPPMPH